MNSTRSRQWQRIFCPHCDERVSKSTYYRHREKYYDVRTGEWRTGVEGVTSSARTSVLESNPHDDVGDSSDSFEHDEPDSFSHEGIRRAYIASIYVYTYVAT